jgi:RNA-splicing ligase RtcB
MLTLPNPRNPVPVAANPPPTARVTPRRARTRIVRAVSKSGVAEEAGFAYKDLDDVVDVFDRVGISRRVASLAPIGNIKG